MIKSTFAVAMEDRGESPTRRLAEGETLKGDDIIHPNVVEQLDDSDYELDKIRRKLDIGVTEVSVESFNLLESGGNAIKSMASNISKFVSAVTGNIKQLAANLNAVKTGTHDYGKLVRYADGHDYFAIRDSVKLYQVARLSMKWKPYMQELLPMAVIASQVKDDVLVPLIEYLARGINDPALFQSNNHKPKYKLADIESTRRKLQKIFSGPTTEYITWGQAFDRNTDVSETISIYSELTQLMEKVKPAVMKESVDLLAQHANIVLKNMENPQAGFMMSKATVKVLGEAIYVAAKYVEFYTAIIQLAYEFDQCLTASQAKLR